MRKQTIHFFTTLTPIPVFALKMNFFYDLLKWLLDSVKILSVIIFKKSIISIYNDKAVNLYIYCIF